MTHKGMMNRCFVLLLAVFTFGRLMAGEPATAVATITAGFVTGITVTSGGSGYTSEPSVTLSGGGGSGATAKAILSEDKVALTLVLTAGSGYLTAPNVVVEPPPKPSSIRVRLVPELTIEGPAGSLARVDATWNLIEPWTMWTNVTVGVDGTVLVDLTPTAGSATRFYRLFTAPPARFVWIEPGTFGMGTPIGGVGRYDDEQFHMVTLTRGFWISNHEVTQAEYLSVMGVNPSFFRGLELPVESVSWINAVEYCKKLTDWERAVGRIDSQQAYRLPTEAEWEYAARAGKNTPASNDNAWNFYNSDYKTHPVRWKSPNNWGLYDMLGNVGEWCEDQWRYFAKDSVTDPRFSVLEAPNTTRVIKGGGYEYQWRDSRLASRNRLNGDKNSRIAGFRVVLSSVR